MENSARLQVHLVPMARLVEENIEKSMFTMLSIY
jgi:hypothetical protein